MKRSARIFTATIMKILPSLSPIPTDRACIVNSKRASNSSPEQRKSGRPRRPLRVLIFGYVLDELFGFVDFDGLVKGLDSHYQESARENRKRKSRNRVLDKGEDLDN